MITVITKARQPLLYLLLGAGASVAIQSTIRLLTVNIDRGSKEDPSSSSNIGGGSSSSSSSSSSSMNTTSRERKKSALYTKTGDKGTSSLYNGERRLKTDVIFEVLGHQDELNCIIGIAREYCLQSQNGLDEMLSEIQSRLFDLGAAVATPIQTSSAKKKMYTEVSDLIIVILVPLFLDFFLLLANSDELLLLLNCLSDRLLLLFLSYPNHDCDSFARIIRKRWRNGSMISMPRVLLSPTLSYQYVIHIYYACMTHPLNIHTHPLNIHTPSYHTHTLVTYTHS